MSNIIAIDQGTTSSRTIIFDDRGSVISHAQREFKQFYPKNGWVEHDLDEIWKTQVETILEAFNNSSLKILSKRSLSENSKTNFVNKVILHVFLLCFRGQRVP